MFLRGSKRVLSVTWSVVSARAASYLQMSEIELLSSGTVQERASRLCFLTCLLVFCGLSYTEYLFFCFLLGWFNQFIPDSGNQVSVWDFQVICCLVNTKHKITLFGGFFFLSLFLKSIFLFHWQRIWAVWWQGPNSIFFDLVFIS